MKNGEVRVVTSAVDNRKRRIIYLLPLFLAAVAIGFLLELSTYESLNFAEIRLAIVQNLPRKWNEFQGGKDTADPSVSHIIEGNGLDEQSENETAILDLKENGKDVGTETTDTVLQLWEQPFLLNLNFSWLRNNVTICARRPEDPSDLRIMPVLVHTARSHFAERVAIRKSWGSLPIYKKWDIRFVFLLGEADRGKKLELNQDLWEAQERDLTQEQNEFGDLIEGTFTDTYKNLTYKHLMGYKWILNFCKNAEFVLKVDDDMFIDIMRWLDWRSKDLDMVAINASAVIPELYCHTFGGTKPIREKGSKWYASPEDWPDEWYPDYCSGWAYALTVDLIQRIYSVSTSIKFFWVDDVFVTGALMEVVKLVYSYKPEIRHIWGEVTGDIAEYRPLCESQHWDEVRKFKAVVYVPRGELFERDMMCMWNKTLHDSTDKLAATSDVA